MFKALIFAIMAFTLVQANDGYVKLSDLDNNTLQSNNFVSLDTLEESSEWVSLTSLEENSFESLDSNMQELDIIVELDTNDDYIALDIYDTNYDAYTNETQEYVSLDEVELTPEYDIVAIYEEMIKEEELAILSMNFEF